MKESLGFDKIVHQFKNYKDGLISVLVGLITLAVERSVEVTLFRCPCDPNRRQIYARLFISIPGVILLVVGIAFNLKVWKLLTGCCGTKSCVEQIGKCCCSGVGWGNFFNILGFAIIAPILWYILTFIDGDYLACAITNVAYEDVANVTCIPDETPFTEDYRNNKRWSQIIGWIAAGSVSVGGLGICMIVRCCSRMTYHQEKFSSNCQKKMEEALVEAFQDSITKTAAENDPDHPSKVVEKYKKQKQPEIFWINLHKDFVSQKNDLTQATLDKYLPTDEAHAGPSTEPTTPNPEPIHDPTQTQP